MKGSITLPLGPNTGRMARNILAAIVDHEWKSNQVIHIQEDAERLFLTLTEREDSKDIEKEPFIVFEGPVHDALARLEQVINTMDHSFTGNLLYDPNIEDSSSASLTIWG